MAKLEERNRRQVKGAGFALSCEEGLVQRGLISSPHRILGQSHQALRVVVVVVVVGEFDAGGFFEVQCTKNVTFHEKESHKNGCEGKDGGGDGFESFLKRFHAWLGWRDQRLKSQRGGKL